MVEMKIKRIWCVRAHGHTKRGECEEVCVDMTIYGDINPVFSLADTENAVL